MKDFSSLLNSGSKVLRIVNKTLPLIKQINFDKIKKISKKEVVKPKKEEHSSSNNTLSFFK